MFVYHYYATIPLGQSTMELDGIVQVKERITSWDEYREVKKAIAEQADLRDPGAKIIVKSLSLLGDTPF